jgi:hypothetical protein
MIFSAEQRARRNAEVTADSPRFQFGTLERGLHFKYLRSTPLPSKEWCITARVVKADRELLAIFTTISKKTEGGFFDS